mmetsp:Transcript_36891/g.115438  ORF Transcript_36891/g.115438 Transcript_36891/m.115438 type:complete len:227 (+) Transcript_36891:30-710(+)
MLCGSEPPPARPARLCAATPSRHARSSWKQGFVWRSCSFSHSGCILRACLRHPSLSANILWQPGKRHMCTSPTPCPPGKPGTPRSPPGVPPGAPPAVLGVPSAPALLLLLAAAAASLLAKRRAASSLVRTIAPAARSAWCAAGGVGAQSPRAAAGAGSSRASSARCRLLFLRFRRRRLASASGSLDEPFDLEPPFFGVGGTDHEMGWYPLTASCTGGGAEYGPCRV